MDRVRQQTVPKEGPTLDYLGLFIYIVIDRKSTRLNSSHRR